MVERLLYGGGKFAGADGDRIVFFDRAVCDLYGACNDADVSVRMAEPDRGHCLAVIYFIAVALLLYGLAPGKLSDAQAVRHLYGTGDSSASGAADRFGHIFSGAYRRNGSSSEERYSLRVKNGKNYIRCKNQGGA